MGLLTGRCKCDQPDCGKSSFVKPSDLAERVKEIQRTLGQRKASRYSRGPKLKDGAASTPAEGQVFLVHILSLEKPPTEFGK